MTIAVDFDGTIVEHIMIEPVGCRVTLITEGERNQTAEQKSFVIPVDEKEEKITVRWR